MLQLEPLPTFLKELQKSSDDEQREMTDEFYRVIDLMKEELSSNKGITDEGIETVPAETLKETTQKPEIQPEAEKTEHTISPHQVPETKPSHDTAPIPEHKETVGFLRDVQIVPIEFSLKIAAEELNLPEELVLEFINDFALQGKEYLPVLIEAYENGDLDKLQKTAHMLKGAASNLRIEPMVENLYELQFDNDISRAPKRIKLFAGQLMSLENYLKQMNTR